MVSGFLTSPLDHVRIESAVARPMRSWSKVFTSSMWSDPLHALCSAACVLFVTAPLGPGDVDPQLLGGAEDVLVELAHLDLVADGVEHLDVEAERLHLLDEHLEALGDA